MIKNERQYAYSRKKLKELEDGLNMINDKYADKPNKAKLLGQGYHEHIAQLREEMAEYERIKSSTILPILRARSSEDLRRRMTELRMLRGMTQADLAKKVGCKQSDISRIEKKDYKGLSLSTLKKIAHALNTSLEICFIPIPIPKSVFFPLLIKTTSSVTRLPSSPSPFSSTTDYSFSGEHINA